MNRLHCWIGLVTLGLAGSLLAESRLSCELADGSRVVGAAVRTSVALRTEFGSFQVELAKVRRVQLLPPPAATVLELRNGDKVSGHLDLAAWELRTIFGAVSLPADQVRLVQVSDRGPGGARPGLVLWNQLGSPLEIEASAVGPAGQYRAGKFVAGKFGDCLELTTAQSGGVVFPRVLFNAEGGCIELWARLVDMPERLADGSNPALFTSAQATLHFNANDGVSHGGLCVAVHQYGSAGTGEFGAWTYGRALGGAPVDEWHHYAVVWDKKGLAELPEGPHKFAVYVDGQLNTGSWHDQGDDPEPAVAGELLLMSTQHLRQGRIQLDNLKIWDHAKTDFSDREQE